MTTIQIPNGADLDPYLRAHRHDTRFLLGAGQYYSAGAAAFADLDYCALAPGCELIGDGALHTRILIDVPANLPPQVEGLTAGSRTGESETVTLRDFTVEPADSGALGRSGFVGVHVWSDHCRISGLRIHGVTGTRPARGESALPSREGFGLLVNEAGRSEGSGGMHIECVEVHLRDAAPSESEELYVCGAYVGLAHPVRPSHVSQIAVVNRSKVSAHAAFGLNGGILGSHWVNVGRWNRALYCDVTGGSYSRISQSELWAERVGVELRGGAGVTWREITVDSSRFNLCPTGYDDYAAGLVLVDDSVAKAQAAFHGVTLQHCTLNLLRSREGQQFYLGSCDAAQVTDCGLVGCRAVGDRILPVVLTRATPISGFGAV